MTAAQRTALGVRRPRVDAVEKLTGAAQFGSDLPVAGLLHGRLVPSPYAHARIHDVDATDALRVPGVVAVLTAADLPAADGSGRTFEPLAADEAVFAGQPVALVVAESEAAALDGAELVHVDYEELPAVVDPEAAMAPGAPLTRVGGGGETAHMDMHGASGPAQTGGEEEELSANVAGRHRAAQGDADTALAGCDHVLEGRFRTPWVHQGHLEPQVASAWLEPDGRLVVHTSTQGITWAHATVARVTGLPTDRIRVIGSALGGGFGAKIGLIEPLVALAALAVRRPVRVAFTRTEDFAAANPAPALIFELRIGARADGELVALRSRVIVDDGAYADSSPSGLVGGRVGGCYRWQAWDVRAYGVRTNRFGSGAYRGPTATQAAFALEQLLDRLAADLGLDPLDLRLRNVVEPGDARLDGATWPRIGMRETLESVREHPLWTGRRELPPHEGVGLAAGLFPGAGMTAGAICRMDPDGAITVVTGLADLTGTATGLVTIAAETLGVPVEQVRLAAVDTDAALVTPVSGGSTITYSLGSAVRAAAEDARTQILEIAAAELEISPDDLEIVEGEIRAVGSPDRKVSLARIARLTTGFGGRYPPVAGNGRTVPPELAPSAAVSLAHVRVDPETGEVRCLRLVAAQDVGRAINPALCEGQITGGAAQSLGWALLEELRHDEDGRLLSGSLLGYALPRAEQVPPIEPILVEVPSPHGPFGARGIGESAIVPGAAAIANAVAAATGVRFHELPLTPARVWRALRDRRG